MDPAVVTFSNLFFRHHEKESYSKNTHSGLLKKGDESIRVGPGIVGQKQQHFSNLQLQANSINASHGQQFRMKSRKYIHEKPSNPNLLISKDKRLLKSPKKARPPDPSTQNHYQKKKKATVSLKKQKKLTKQLIQFNSSEYPLSRSQKPNPKINPKIDGWETKNSSHHFFIDKNGHIVEVDGEGKKYTSTTGGQSRPLSRNKNTQFETQQFLKEIKLKYAKALKFRQNQQHKKTIENCQTEPSPIVIEDQDQLEQPLHGQKFETIETGTDSFVKYSHRKTLLNLKKIVPDASQNFKNARNTSREYQSSYLESLAERVNHDSLMPRPDSRTKSRMSSKLLATSLEKGGKRSGRHMTIDSSQLPVSQHKKKSEYVGYNKAKKQELNKNISHKYTEASDNQHNGNNLGCQGRLPDYQSRRNRATKIKLKYLKSLKYGHYSHMSTIEPHKFENAKIQPEVKSIKHLKTESAIPKYRQDGDGHEVPLQARISALGKEDFRQLRKLLEKEGEPAYLLWHKEMLP